MCPSSDAIASVDALQTVYGGRACGGTGHAAGSKACRSCEDSDARPPRTCGAYVSQQRVTMDPTRIIAGAKALDKPCPSLILAASSGALVMAVGRRLYALQTHKAMWVTHMSILLYECELTEIMRLR